MTYDSGIAITYTMEYILIERTENGIVITYIVHFDSETFW